jgi:hypothetical protein
MQRLVSSLSAVDCPVHRLRKKTKDPTDKFQKLINKTMQEYNLIIDKRQIKFLTKAVLS